MNPIATTLQPGFSEPVQDSQQVFRAVLDALSRPLRPRSLNGITSTPAPLSPLSGAVLLALADADTPIWLSPALDQPAVRDWLTFHSGAVFCDQPNRAAFAVCTAAEPLRPVDDFDLSSPEVPQASTTVLIQGVSLADSGLGSITARGPGIKDSHSLSVGGLANALVAWWAANTVLYPQGIDALLLDERTLCGLSRTTTLSITAE